MQLDIKDLDVFLMINLLIIYLPISVLQPLYVDNDILISTKDNETSYQGTSSFYIVYSTLNRFTPVHFLNKLFSIIPVHF